MHTRTGPRHRGRARTAILLALAVTAMLLAACLGPVGSPAPAQATVPGTDSTTLYWDTKNRVYYGYYNTPIFTTTDSNDRVSFAYCVDPNTTVPPAGSYGTISVENFNPGWEAQTRAAMWFGYGGPGFDPAMWPDTWSDGSEMTAPRYYAASHLILSYVTSRTMGYVYYNAGSRFIQYAAQTFMGIDLQGNVRNDHSTLFQMLERADEVPSDYNCYYLDCGRTDYVQYIVAQDYYQVNGSLAIQKTSLDPSVSESNPCYSLVGAVFGVYADQSCTEPFATLTTDENGYAALFDVAAGDYWVKEITAPPGFALDPAAYPLACDAGTTNTLEVPNIPQMDRLPVIVLKVDAETGGAPQAEQALAGAEFEVCFYSGRYEAGNLPEQPDRRWVFATDSSGEARLAPDFLVSGDGLYYDAAGSPALPLGTVTVREIKPPDGYTLSDPSVHVLAITSNGNGATVSTYVVPTVGDTVERGSLAIQKVGAETGSPLPQGSASMEAAEFSVVSLNSGPVVVQGSTYGRGEVVATLVTDQTGRAATAPGLLPCGTYTVTETTASWGYLVNEETRTVVIREDGATVELDSPVLEQVQRGGFGIRKLDVETAPGPGRGLQCSVRGRGGRLLRAFGRLPHGDRRGPPLRDAALPELGEHPGRSYPQRAHPDSRYQRRSDRISMAVASWATSGPVSTRLDATLAAASPGDASRASRLLRPRTT